MKLAIKLSILFFLSTRIISAQISNTIKEVEDTAQDVVVEIEDFAAEHQFKRKLAPKYKNRLEAYFTYDHLDPDSLYDAWQSETIGYYHSFNDEFNYHLIGTMHQRYVNGFLFEAGIRRTWTRRFFSDLAFSMGSEVDYLQKLRLDINLYYKLLEKESLIFSLGTTFINYHSEYDDQILRASAAYYFKRWIAEYVVFRNRSNPGDVVTFTHQGSIGYGQEFKHWTYLIYSHGRQGYLATYLEVPEEVSNKTYEITLKHRHWFGKNYGPFLHLVYTNLDKSYEKYGFTLGVFWQF